MSPDARKVCKQLPDGVFQEDNSPWSEPMNEFIAAAKKRDIPVTKMRRALGEGQFASSFNLLLPPTPWTPAS